MNRRLYRLGGPRPAKWFTARRMGMASGGIALLLGGVILGMVIQQWWTAVLGVIGAALVWLSLLGQGSPVEPLVDSASSLLRRPLASWGGWDAYDPTLDASPFWLRGGREVSVSSGAGRGEVGMFDAQGALTAVLEIEGDGDGIREDTEHRRLEDAVVEVLQTLARGSVPVSQIDVITRVIPAQGAEHRAWVEQRRGQDVPAAVQESMSVLTDEAELLAETIRTFLVIRMPAPALGAAARDRSEVMDESSVPAQALLTVAAVSKQLVSHGIVVRRALSSQEKAALIRSIWVPSHGADDLAGVDPDIFWAAWPRFDPEPHAVVATGAAGDRWWHAAGAVPRTGYPETAVYGRWLAPAIFARGIFWRTIQVQYRLVSQREAKTVAHDQLDTSAARKIREDRKGQMASGESDDQMSVDQMILNDVAVGGQAGVVTAVRMVVCANNPQLWARFRDETERIFYQDLGVRDFIWDDHRHTVGVLAALPLGMEVATI